MSDFSPNWHEGYSVEFQHLPYCQFHRISPWCYGIRPEEPQNHTFLSCIIHIPNQLFFKSNSGYIPHKND